MMELIASIKALPLAEIGQALLMVLGGASVIAKLTPTEADDKIINSIYKVIQALGLNKNV